MGGLMNEARARYANDVIGRLEEMVSECRAAGNSTLAYFLEMAMIEARIQEADGTLREPVLILDLKPARLEER